MKANSPKRKVFQDALDLLTEDMAVDKAVSENGILQIAIDKITPFHDHPFRLYEENAWMTWCRASGSMES